MRQQPVHVNDATAWKGADFQGDDSWIHTLTARDVEELASAAKACLERGLPATDIGRKDFPLPGLGPTIGAWAGEINNGRGFLLVRGLPEERFSDAEVRTIFWGIGLYM